MSNRKTPAPATRVAGIEMYGVRLNLHCDYAPLLDYMIRLLPGMSGKAHEQPHLSVFSRWIEEPLERGVSLFPDSPELNGLGKRMEIAADELVWFNTHRDKDLQLRFRKHNDTTVFDVAYCYQPSKKKAAKYPDYRQKKFFDLARYLVFFPVAWHLERTRGWEMIHASAVADGDQALLFAGPGGAGKTTTCVALIARTNMKLLTENLLFTDGSRVYPLVEPLRLTEASLALLGDDLKGLKSVDMPGGLRSKTMFWLPDEQLQQSARAAAVFIPQFAGQGFIDPVDPAIATEQIHATNILTLELNDYYWYRSGLNLLWPATGHAQQRLQVLQDLTTNAVCYSLGIDKSAGVDAVVDQIMDCLQSLKEAKEVTIR